MEATERSRTELYKKHETLRAAETNRVKLLEAEQEKSELEIKWLHAKIKWLHYKKHETHGTL